LPQHSSRGKQHTNKANTATFAANLLETEQVTAYTVQYISQQTQHISLAQTITFQQKQHISQQKQHKSEPISTYCIQKQNFPCPNDEYYFVPSFARKKRRPMTIAFSISHTTFAREKNSEILILVAKTTTGKYNKIQV
jgi:hypothetical protein